MRCSAHDASLKSTSILLLHLKTKEVVFALKSIACSHVATKHSLYCTRLTMTASERVGKWTEVFLHTDLDSEGDISVTKRLHVMALECGDGRCSPHKLGLLSSYKRCGIHGM